LDARISVLVLGGVNVRCALGTATTRGERGRVLVVDCGVVRRSLSVVRFLDVAVRSCPKTDGSSITPQNVTTRRMRAAVPQVTQRCRCIFIPSVSDHGSIPNCIGESVSFIRYRKSEQMVIPITRIVGVIPRFV
jgi:hypothetical protein